MFILEAAAAIFALIVVSIFVIITGAKSAATARQTTERDSKIDEAIEAAQIPPIGLPDTPRNFSILYTNLGGERTERNIEIISVEPRLNSGELDVDIIAMCSLRKAQRTFKASRIRKLLGPSGTEILNPLDYFIKHPRRSLDNYHADFIADAMIEMGPSIHSAIRDVKFRRFSALYTARRLYASENSRRRPEALNKASLNLRNQIPRG